MRDILSLEDGMDLGLASTSIPKAANVLSVQLGELSYAPTFGVDKKYFLETPVLFQNQSFKAYLVKRLAEHQINIAKVGEAIESLFIKYTFQVAERIDYAPPQFTPSEIIDNVLQDADGDFLYDSDGSPLVDAF